MVVNTDCDKINSKSNYIQELITDYDKEVKNITDALDEIGQFWEGESYNKFYAKMSEFIVMMNSVGNYIKTVNNFSNGYAKAMNLLDEKYQSKTITLK